MKPLTLDFFPFQTARRGLGLSGLVLLALLVAGCGPRAPEPTPTPTKTPVPEANEPAASVADTATPVPALPTVTPTLPPADTPTPIPAAANVAPYTGLPVDDPALLEKSPVFVCINNDVVGRSSHYGLNAADVTYEYIVDGFTMTRITGMYHSNPVTRIGPVRSARLPNIWMTYMYDGVLACSGGSDAVRYLLKNEVGFPYLDADTDDPSNSVYFSSLGTDYRTRLQISTDGVRRWLADTNNVKDWGRTGFPFSPNPPDFAAGEATSIQIPYPGGNRVEWRYDPGSGRYLRFQGGAPHMDQASGQQISSENVIVISAEHELTDIVEDSLGTRSVDIQLYGFGDLRVFRDGKVYEGTWRANDQSPPRWLGPGEQPIDLKPGRSWVQVIRTTDTIQY